jgi:very-short-patch-repair endonuclease/DNA polymerase III delta prime subunit
MQRSTSPSAANETAINAASNPDIRSGRATVPEEMVFEKLRQKLLDLRKTNPMVSFKHTASSKALLRLIDEVPDEVYRALVVDERSLEIVGVPEPDLIPEDENTSAFRQALKAATESDPDFLAVSGNQAMSRPAHRRSMKKAEIDLRQRVRASLGMQAFNIDLVTTPAAQAAMLGINTGFDLPLRANGAAHTDKRLQTLHWQDSAAAIVDKISGKAKLAEQEMGVSTLYLAIGFLEWAEQKNSEKVYQAPLLLLPVELESWKNPSGQTVWTVTSSGGAAEQNATLDSLLKSDFGLSLPRLDPDDETADVIESYFRAVEQTIDQQRGWRVRRFLTLGNFAFGRLAMYADLDPANWSAPPWSRDLIASVLRGAEETGDLIEASSAPPGDYEIDLPENTAAAPYLILDADGSQHSAIIDAMRGKNLVIQGPPGTGKSQTIANLIANCLAAGKTVLFLAEKMAALEVVKRRLDTAGLGDFCLELHSDKAAPKDVIASLKKRLEMGTTSAALPPYSNEQHSRTKGILARYLDHLHRPSEAGTPYQQFGQSLRMSNKILARFPAVRNLELPDWIVSSDAGLQQALRLVGDYALAVDDRPESALEVQDCPWRKFSFATTFGPGNVNRLTAQLEQILIRARSIDRLRQSAAAFDWNTRGELAALENAEAVLPSDPPSDDWLSKIGPDTEDDARSLAQLIATLQSVGASAAGQDPSIDEVRQIVPLLKEAITNFDGAPPDERPAATYDQLAKRASVTAALVSELTRLKSVAATFGPEDHVSVGAIAAAHKLWISLCDLPEVLRRDCLAEPARTLAEIEQLRSVLEVLERDEAMWRSRFTETQARWPSPDVLKAAAAGRGATGIAAVFDANQKMLREANISLGLPEKIKSVGAEDYTALARHVSELAAFENDHRAKQRLGCIWQGLQTSLESTVEQLAQAVSAREALRSQHGGDHLLARLAMSDAELRAALSGLGAQPLKALVRYPGIIRRVEPMTLEAALDWLIATQASAQRILSVDPDRRLAILQHTWPRLATMVQQIEARDAILEAIARHPLAHLATAITHDPEGAAVVMAWHRLAARACPTAALRQWVCQVGATQTRAAFSAVVNETSSLAVQIDNDCAALAQTGVTGLVFDNLNEFVECVSGLVDARASLRSYIGELAAVRELEAAGLAAVMRSTRDAGVPFEELGQAIGAAVRYQRAMRHRSEDAVLSKVVGSNLDHARKEFARTDRDKLAYDQRTVFNKLIPKTAAPGRNKGPRATWTEGPYLFNEIAKERRFRPVRELMLQASSSVQSLKPCMMMSPLSLAKFVPANTAKFDILIIDEASQMRPEDALGALMRSHQIVVVGDPKQLPPSDFFTKTMADSAEGDGSSDELDDVDDESILESCHRTFGTVRVLKWHYRSRCESLIAFSNSEIYRPSGRPLITFPAARPESFSIDRIRVEGAFEDGANAAEAQRAVAEASRFIRLSASEARPKTLGLVAMNAKQAELIEEEWSVAKANDPSIDIYLQRCEAIGEPFFIKNLENVQGDERDCILISMTYGPRSGQSVVPQRFGPINGRHGDRRLNVLFTRARIRIGLITSMDSKDVKPTETSSRGIHLLQKYLAFVERGSLQEREALEREPDSDFEIEVADRLRNQGFEVVYQIGVSGFRIDLGIVHPDRPHEFLAGVECDGARYHSAKSAKDRDRLRQEVLEGLGWNILRVWSTDWFDDPGVETLKLAGALRALADRPSRASDSAIFSTTAPPPIPGDALTYRDEALDGNAITQTTCANMTVHDGAPDPKFDTDAPLTSGEAVVLLRRFRDEVIAVSSDTFDPDRSLLRESMIEAFVKQQPRTEDEWLCKIPTYLRSDTDGGERQKYLGAVLALIDRIE